MIIDAHSHWLPQEIISNAHFFSNSWGDIESHLARMDDAGIDKAVLSYPTSDAHLKLGGQAEVARIYNDNVARLIKRYPGRFIGAAALPVGGGSGMLDELKRCTEELGFAALSLASSYNGTYLDDDAFEPIYGFAERRGMPIFVHSQIVNPIGWERVQDPLLTPVIEYVFDTTVCIGRLLMAGILGRHERLRFVFGYFGGAICHLGARFDATYRMLRSINFVKDLKADPTDYLKRIYVDTSGDPVRTNFLAALELLGAQHLLWGSDWPAKKEIGASLETVRGLDIEEKDKEDILGANAARLLQGE